MSGRSFGANESNDISPLKHISRKSVVITSVCVLVVLLWLHTVAFRDPLLGSWNYIPYDTEIIERERLNFFRDGSLIVEEWQIGGWGVNRRNYFTYVVEDNRIRLYGESGVFVKETEFTMTRHDSHIFPRYSLHIFGVRYSRAGWRGW